MASTPVAKPRRGDGNGSANSADKRRSGRTNDSVNYNETVASESDSDSDSDRSSSSNTGPGLKPAATQPSANAGHVSASDSDSGSSSDSESSKSSGSDSDSGVAIESDDDDIKAGHANKSDISAGVGITAELARIISRNSESNPDRDYDDNDDDQSVQTIASSRGGVLQMAPSATVRIFWDMPPAASSSKLQSVPRHVKADDDDDDGTVCALFKANTPTKRAPSNAATPHSQSSSQEARSSASSSQVIFPITGTRAGSVTATTASKPTAVAKGPKSRRLQTLDQSDADSDSDDIEVPSETAAVNGTAPALTALTSSRTADAVSVGSARAHRNLTSPAPVGAAESAEPAGTAGAAGRSQVARSAAGNEPAVISDSDPDSQNGCDSCVTISSSSSDSETDS